MVPDLSATQAGPSHRTRTQEPGTDAVPDSSATVASSRRRREPRRDDVVVAQRRRRLRFVAELSVWALWTTTALAAPLVAALLLSGEFVVTYPGDDPETFALHWGPLAFPERQLAVYLCLEMLVTRLWCVRETWCVLRAARPRKAAGHLAASVAAALLADTAALTWTHAASRTCAEIDPGDLRVSRTLAPLCAQSEETEAAVVYMHYTNAALLPVVAVLVADVALRSSG